jgi:hypothetical protein
MHTVEVVLRAVLLKGLRADSSNHLHLLLRL